MAISASILYTGAPDARSLSWTEEDFTAPLWSCFSDNKQTNSPRLSSAEVRPAWRSIRLEKYHLPTGLTPTGAELYVGGDLLRSSPVEEVSFLNTYSISLISSTSEFASNAPPLSIEADEFMSQFYEYSIAVHEGVPSSQIVGSNSPNETSFLSLSTDYSLSQLSNSSVPFSAKHTKVMPPPVHLSELRDIPNAAYLKSINPQTITVNLIVGLISISQPRLIRLRKNKQSMELIELTVGDETKAGFGINLWLPSSSDFRGTSSLKEQARYLRPRDVLMIRNLALSSFGGNVYGQSLRKDMTKLDLLYRITVDKYDQGGIIHAHDLDQASEGDQYIRKVKRVKDWVMIFVGGGLGEGTGGPDRGRGVGRKANVHDLPPDTQ